MVMNERKLVDSLAILFEFTEEEDDAIHGFIPMTQEIFNSCITKCSKLSPDTDVTYCKLIETYPDLYEVFKSRS